MRVLAIALGGCLRAPPVPYGMTEDTGGHIAYILGAMAALARDPRVTRADIATRLFDEPALGRIHAATRESIGPKSEIVRIDSGDRRYLAKEDLARDRDAFTRALIAHLRGADHLPDIIHAHFADAADVARRVRDALGIPFIYTAHSLGRDKAAMLDCNADLAARLREEDRAIGSAD
ncbi:MAG: HAD family hydrolase, partial [Croceicoccus sp.]|nr:HAD family hydrolase [Croceicoccus sp.]